MMTITISHRAGKGEDSDNKQVYLSGFGKELYMEGEKPGRDRTKNAVT